MSTAETLDGVASAPWWRTVRPGGLLVKTSIVAAIAVGGVWTATRGLAGVAWADVGAVLAAVDPGRLAMLALIWFAGLVVYATVLAGSLPGLGVRRGLLLNLTGSAVSNLMPLGGAVGTALNWRMVRSWGHSQQAFASFFVLTNALDVLTKLFLPPLAVAALVMVSTTVPAPVWTLAGTCVLALLVALAAGAVTMSRLRLPPGRLDTRLWAFWVRVFDVADRTRGLLAANWSRLLPGSVAYLVAQIVLLVLCLRAVGIDSSLPVIVMAGAIERAASLVPITPAGTGFAEIGTIAWLVTSGLDPASVVAGVLLYRVFLVALEVPVGCALLSAWTWLRLRNASLDGRRSA